MKRRDFLRNTMMAFAVSLVPKILQPSIPEIPKLIEAWCKVSKEMLKDLPAMEWFTKNVALRNLKKVEGYDPFKSVEVKIGDEKNDFYQNTTTVVVSQFI